MTKSVTFTIKDLERILFKEASLIQDIDVFYKLILHCNTNTGIFNIELKHGKKQELE